MRPIGRSAQELPVEYQVEALFINFSVSSHLSSAEKGCREAPGFGILLQSLYIYSQSNDFTATVPVPKSYENYIVKNQLFMCLQLYPLLLLRPNLDSSHESMKVTMAGAT